MGVTVNIEVFEDWGPAIGSPAKGTSRTAITNANLKTYSDPDQHYFLNDLRRPRPRYNDQLYTITHKRYIFWKLSGTYSKIQNVRIELPAPDGSKFQMFYGLTNQYAESQMGSDVFGKNNGVFDGTLTPFTEAMTLFPNLSTTGPESATSRAISYGPNQTLYTGYLVLQGMALQSTYDDVGPDFGVGTISLKFDELE